VRIFCAGWKVGGGGVVKGLWTKLSLASVLIDDCLVRYFVGIESWVGCLTEIPAGTSPQPYLGVCKVPNGCFGHLAFLQQKQSN
jgi:hypothetical protein